MPRVAVAAQEGTGRVPRTGALPASRRRRRVAHRSQPLMAPVSRSILPCAAVEAYLTATNLDALEAGGELLPHEARALEALRAAAAAAAPPVLSGTQLFRQLEASQLLSTVGQAVGGCPLFCVAGHQGFQMRCRTSMLCLLCRRRAAKQSTSTCCVTACARGRCWRCAESLVSGRLGMDGRASLCTRPCLHLCSRGPSASAAPCRG